MIKTIGIIGHTGTVGSAMFAYYIKRNDLRVLGYSIDSKNNYRNTDITELAEKSDIIFVAVPTPQGRGLSGHDLSAIHNVLQKLSPESIVIIRSTVVPGTIEKLQKKYDKLILLYNPEFLSQATAAYDFSNPDRQIVGFTKKSKVFAKTVLQLLPKAQYQAIIPATEAEVVKYVSTLFAAVKVIFANQIYDLCQTVKADYGQVLESFAASKWLRTGQEKSYMDVFDKGYRGYNGRCLPKDINAIVTFSKSKGLKLELIESAQRINNKLLKNKT